MPLTRSELTTALKHQAAQLGFEAAGVCPAVAAPGWDRFVAWLNAGFAGEMRYLPERSAAYAHPDSILSGVRSILMLGMNYRGVEPRSPAPGEARISRYAWGEADYHDLIHERLRHLRDFLLQLRPRAAARGVVDTAPLLERDYAQLAGLGWVGKNTLLLNRHLGSWFFLAALLTDEELEYDSPFQADHCGTCRACLDACPTQAFPQPYVLDATRCISYLTIELRGDVPRHLREGLGDWLFGCDVCQDVCPWNRRSPTTLQPAFGPASGADPVELSGLFDLDDASFRRRFRHTPLWRSRRRGILRNAALVLGNQGHSAGIPALRKGLNDDEPLVRSASAWGLGRIGGADAHNALKLRLEWEPDGAVRDEIQAALSQAGGSGQPQSP